jgi:hypothetical protein
LPVSRVGLVEEGPPSVIALDGRPAERTASGLSWRAEAELAG